MSLAFTESWPWRSVPCRDGAGNSIDLSSLSRYSDNWEAVTRTGATEHYLINICKSLSPRAGGGGKQSFPPGGREVGQGGPCGTEDRAGEASMGGRGAEGLGDRIPM